MGSPEGELGRQTNEVLHTVTQSKAFYIRVFEVTQKQYERVMGSNPSYVKGNTRPVEWVTYRKLRGQWAAWPGESSVAPDSFFGILSRKTGLEFGLPTEAQWKNACRAGTTSALNSGKDLTTSTDCPNMAGVGRYWYNSGRATAPDPACDASEATATVGSYRPNAWGLHDMHGNVWKVCLDWSGSYPSSPVTDPKGSATGTARVVRGGSWLVDARHCRSAARSEIPPANSGNTCGFRICLP